MRIRVTHNIDDLASDLAQIPALALRDANAAVNHAKDVGNKRAQAIARAEAGPHGRDYWKRLSAEMVGPLSAEYGPTGPPKTDYVGVSGTAGAQRDLARSAPVAGRALAEQIREAMDGWFWSA